VQLQEAWAAHSAATILQSWHLLVLQRLEATAVLRRCCLEAWAAIAQQRALLRFLLTEHTAIKQVSCTAVHSLHGKHTVS